MEFHYTIKDPLGIHARPAGLLSREGKKYKSTITILRDGDEVNVLRLMALMKLCVKSGDTITVRIEGEDEAAAAAAMQAFLSEHL